MHKILLVSAAAMLATGCSHMRQQAITEKDLASLRNQTIVQTSAPVPGFSVLRFNALVLATGLDLKNEDSMIRSAGVIDPAVSMSATLSASLAAGNGARILPQRIAVTGDDVAQIAAAARSSARYVLDVRTMSWLLSYQPLAWNSYALAYSASARLIDTQTSLVVAQGHCSQGYDKTIDPQPLEVMMSNQAARLKRQLDLTAEACTKIFSEQMSLCTPGPLVRAVPPALVQRASPGVVTAMPVAAAPVAQQPMIVLQPAPVVQATAAPVTRQLDAYEMALAEVQARNNRLDPNSVYFDRNVFDWVMERKAEHMQTGLAAPEALRRAVQNLERP